MIKQTLLLGVLALGALRLSAQDATPMPIQDPSMMTTAEATMDMGATTEAMPAATLEMMSTMEAGIWPDTITIEKEGLFPEGVEYDPINNRFFLSSVSEGTVYAVDETGALTPFVQDERIPTSLGLEVDEERNRLLVAVTDQATTAFLGSYDLTTGENLFYVDLSVATPNDKEHFANDIAVDSQGNAYVTDSYAGVIYKVDLTGNVSVWLEDEAFSTQFALNGLDYQPEGDYILAVLVPNLIKIPVANPTAFVTIMLDTPISGGDGLAILNPSTAAVVSNDTGRVYRVESIDDFETATVTDRFDTGPVNPTTLALVHDNLYVIYAQLNAQEETRSSFPLQKVMFSSEMMMTQEPMATTEVMTMAEPMATAEATTAP